MPSLRLPIVINREIDNALKRVSESTRIPVSTLARDAIIDMLARHGEVVENVPKPGGNRYKSTQDTAEDSTIEQDKPTMAQNDTEASKIGHDVPLDTVTPVSVPARTLSPAEILAQRRSGAAGKGLPALGSNGKRRNGASGEE